MSVRLVRWGEGDFALLERLLGDPAMTEHLGGPEDAEALAKRQKRYVEAEDGVFKVVDEESGADAGWVGFWEYEREGERICEIGWAVVPELQGRGIAAAATAAAIERIRARRDRAPFVYAWPKVANGPSNAVCRKLGFELVREVILDYPPGSGAFAPYNEWRLEL